MVNARGNGLAITMVTRIPLPLARLVEREAKKLRTTKTAVLVAALKEHFGVEDRPAA